MLASRFLNLHIGTPLISSAEFLRHRFLRHDEVLYALESPSCRLHCKQACPHRTEPRDNPLDGLAPLARRAVVQHLLQLQ